MAVLRMNLISMELGMATNVTAILPSFDQAYDIGKSAGTVYESDEKIPVLWLLHGGSGDDADYLNWTNIARYAVEYNCAVICPCDYNAAYNDYPRGAKYYKYITEELRDFIFSRFPRLSDRREDNFIGGLSMGSGGAMKIALDKCEQYSYALIMSGGLPPKNGGARPTGHSEFRKKLIDAGWPMPKQPADVSRNDPLRALDDNLAAGRKLPVFLLCCGESDPIACTAHLNAAKIMEEKGIEHVRFSLPGYKHEWDFWEIVLRKALAEWLPVKQKDATDTASSAWNAEPEKFEG